MALFCGRGAVCVRLRRIRALDVRALPGQGFPPVLDQREGVGIGHLAGFQAVVLLEFGHGLARQRAKSAGTDAAAVVPQILEHLLHPDHVLVGRHVLVERALQIEALGIHLATERAGALPQALLLAGGLGYDRVVPKDVVEPGNGVGLGRAAALADLVAIAGLMAGRLLLRVRDGPVVAELVKRPAQIAAAHRAVCALHALLGAGRFLGDDPFVRRVRQLGRVPLLPVVAVAAVFELMAFLGAGRFPLGDPRAVVVAVSLDRRSRRCHRHGAQQQAGGPHRFVHGGNSLPPWRAPYSVAIVRQFAASVAVRCASVGQSRDASIVSSENRCVKRQPCGYRHYRGRRSLRMVRLISP